MSGQDVLFEIRGSAAWMTISRPEKRNALRGETVDELLGGLERAASVDEVRAVVLSGDGDKAFCAGADLGGTEPVGRRGSKATARYAELLKAMAAFPKPILARVQGDCVGGGMGLLLSCDIAHAVEHARFGTPEGKVGLFPMMISALLLRAAPRARALEMVYTGRLVAAAEALSMGLVARVHPDLASLDTAVDRDVEAASRLAPLAVRTGRVALSQIEGIDLGAAIDLLREELEYLMGTEDAAEGMRAFQEKRDPVWKGR